MFAPEGRLKSLAEHERLLRRRAREEAGALFRAQGPAALGAADAMRFPVESDPGERRHERLIVAELERLDREARRTHEVAPDRRETLWRRIRGFIAGS